MIRHEHAMHGYLIRRPSRIAYRHTPIMKSHNMTPTIETARIDMDGLDIME